MKGYQVKTEDQKNIVGMYGRFDLAIKRGKGSKCWDYDGNEYIDFTSGIGVNSLGFCDDEWIKAVGKQLKKLQHVSNLYYTEPQVEVAMQLTSRTGLKKVSFANSGAEANEAAIKVARKYGSTVLGLESNKIITLRDSFHGRTLATVTATGQDKFHQYFTPFPGGFDYCEANNTEELEKKVDAETCAIMLEVIQGEGGVRDLDVAFLQKAQELCRENDLLLIIDEVQTGAGRTGKLFAYEHYGLEPDIVTFAKGMGGGLPIGGALYSEKCCDIFQPGDHGSTFGANPVACAGAEVILKRLTDVFLDWVSEKAESFRERIRQMPNVKKISGKGLMIGIELEQGEAIDVVKKAMDKGLLLLTAGSRVRLLPPLNISEEDMNKGLDILEKALDI